MCMDSKVCLKKELIVDCHCRKRNLLKHEISIHLNALDSDFAFLIQYSWSVIVFHHDWSSSIRFKNFECP
jgi:ABC-type uncharacterized transport system permease subunit